MSSTGYNNSTPPLIPGDIQVSNIAVNKKIQTPFEAVLQETDSSTGVECFSTSFFIATETFSTPAQGTTSFTVTNPNLVLNNNVIASIASYTGALGTNGFPVMTLKATGPGEYTVFISNVAPLNALNGTFIINFYIFSG